MKLLVIYLSLLLLVTSCRDVSDCMTRGEKIDDYIYNMAVPYGDQLTLRNDSLVISTDHSVKFDEEVESYNSYIKRNPKFISNEHHYLIDISNGELIDTLKTTYVPSFNRGKISSAFFSTDTNTIKKSHILIHTYTITNNFKGFQINLEWWEPKVRCSGEHRIAVYRKNQNVKNLKLQYGVHDYLLDGDSLIILSAYSEWPNRSGRHLQKISLDKIVTGLKIN